MPTVDRNLEASLVLMMSMNRFITTSASHWPGGHHGDGDANGMFDLDGGLGINDNEPPITIMSIMVF